jgi:mannose-6-phosphate isomerase-like protein (cupin superfamily)
MITEETGHFDFPDFVRDLPEADLPFEGLRGWLLRSEDGQVLFMETDADVDVTEHSHGDQWGIVVDGEIELTIGGETAIYRRGDSYYIPAGVKHGARLFAGFKALDCFKDRDRYRVRE